MGLEKRSGSSEFKLNEENNKAPGYYYVVGIYRYQSSGKLVEIKGVMDGFKYDRILQENLIESARKLGTADKFVFQQDNDPKHKSRIAIDFFLENKIEVKEWPSQSPDLNVIEHVLAYIKCMHGKVVAPNKKDAIKKIFQIWENIAPSLTEKLIGSIYKRCKEVIRLKSKATKYRVVIKIWIFKKF